jgi:ABC-2 type transport system permease protein
MSDVMEGAVLQLRTFRRGPGDLLLFAVIPFFSAIFLSVASNRGHSYLLARPILAPAVIGLWMVSVVVAEMVVASERGYGTLEVALAAPASFARVIAGRVLTVTLLGLITVLEALGMAWGAFGASVAIYHPAVFAVALLVNAVATSGTATALTAAFLASRASQRYVNTLGYPFYILAGVLVPITFLPSWIRPFSYVLYLHWTAGLLYGSMSRGTVADPVLAVTVTVLIGLASYGLGVLLIRKVINNLRASGAVGLS